MNIVNKDFLWLGVFFLLITGLYALLMQKKHVLVPIVLPFTFFIAEVDIFLWLRRGGWNSVNQLTWLMGFVLVGLLLLYQSFADRRWYLFRGGGFVRDIESYHLLAKDIVEFLWLHNLPPSTVLFRYEGILGLSQINEKDEDAFFACVDENLAETKWVNRGPWHLFFTFQWLFIISTLVIQVIYLLR